MGGVKARRLGEALEKPSLLAALRPPFEKPRRMGYSRRGDVGEIKSLGHPPDYFPIANFGLPSGKRSDTEIIERDRNMSVR